MGAETRIPSGWQQRRGGSVACAKGLETGLNEAETHAKLVDPALHGRGRTEDLIRREGMAETGDIVEGRAR